MMMYPVGYALDYHTVSTSIGIRDEQGRLWRVVQHDITYRDGRTETTYSQHTINGYPVVICGMTERPGILRTQQELP